MEGPGAGSVLVTNGSRIPDPNPGGPKNIRILWVRIPNTAKYWYFYVLHLIFIYLVFFTVFDTGPDGGPGVRGEPPDGGHGSRLQYCLHSPGCLR